MISTQTEHSKCKYYKNTHISWRLPNRIQLDTPHSVGLIGPSQRPDKTQHSQETDIHVPAGLEPATPASDRPQTLPLHRSDEGLKTHKKKKHHRNQEAKENFIQGVVYEVCQASACYYVSHFQQNMLHQQMSVFIERYTLKKMLVYVNLHCCNRKFYNTFYNTKLHQ
jgi:hypothetical protein